MWLKVTDYECEQKATIITESQGCMKLYALYTT